jgi:hypothetical protein
VYAGPAKFVDPRHDRVGIADRDVVVGRFAAQTRAEPFQVPFADRIAAPAKAVTKTGAEVVDVDRASQRDCALFDRRDHRRNLRSGLDAGLPARAPARSPLDRRFCSAADP